MDEERPIERLKMICSTLVYFTDFLALNTWCRVWTSSDAACPSA